MDVQLIEGDITEQHVDAIVNAANSSLMGGGGVDGAIHRKGGPAILADCRDLRSSRYGAGLPTGQAVATTAGNLNARFVIHTVGPVYESDVDKSALLRACYTNSLAIADELGLASIAFPLISSGIFGWPIDDAVHQAFAGINAARSPITDVRLVLFGAPTLAIAQRVKADRH